MAQSTALLQLAIVSYTFELLKDAIFHTASIDRKEAPTQEHFIIAQSCIKQCPQCCNLLFSSLELIVNYHQLKLGLFLSVTVIEPIAATMEQSNDTSKVELT
jgi:hypothetical protein